MKLIKVLIVDDHALVRKFIRELLQSDESIQVIGEATNGSDAVDMVKKCLPDVVIMDLYMPVMNGMEAITHIMAFNPGPILVLTDGNNANTAYSVIEKGALDILEKSDINLLNPKKFTDKIKLFSQVTVISHPLGRRNARLVSGQSELYPEMAGIVSGKVIAIASSSGGPRALATIFKELRADFPVPILVAQHINGEFLPHLLQWLNEISDMKIHVAEHQEKITAGTVYFPPPSQHLGLDKDGCINLFAVQTKDSYCPSGNFLLSSVAHGKGAQGIGVILTGMGDDGVIGIANLKKAGGITIAQDEATSAIFGMPKIAIESGMIDRIAPLDKIGSILLELVTEAHFNSVEKIHDVTRYQQI